MAEFFDRFLPKHRAFIERQRVFFTGSAAAEGRVNVSPKDGASLRVLNERRLGWLDMTGSGNETAAHIRASQRLTVMLCAFDGPPLIMRVYGQGSVHPLGSAPYTELAPLFPTRHGARQITTLEVEQLQTSCGYGVPLMDFRADRDGLDRWAETKDDEALEAYRIRTTARSIDGLPSWEPLRP